MSPVQDQMRMLMQDQMVHANPGSSEEIILEGNPSSVTTDVEIDGALSVFADLLES